MNKSIIKIVLILVAGQFLCVNYVKGQSQKITSDSLRIITGELENGLKYIIKPIPDNQEKIVTQLFIKVGEKQEDRDQYKHAHLLEHLAFNSTENFPDLKNDTEFFGQNNVSPRDLFANVGGDKTQYRFDYSPENPENINLAFSIYDDILSGKVKFEEKAIIAEKKAVYQEKIGGGGDRLIYANAKIGNHFSDCLNVLPPDKVEDELMNTTNDALRRFYKDWYRPDLSTISVIGNLENPEEVEQKLIRKFSALKNSVESREKKDCERIYYARPRQFFVLEDNFGIKDSDLPITTYQFYYRDSHNYFSELSNYRNQELWSIIAGVLNKRLAKFQASYNIDYSAYIHKANFLPAINLEIKSSGEPKESIKKVFSILKDISQNGITLQEWEIFKDEWTNNRKGFLKNSPGEWAKLIAEAMEPKKNLSDLISAKKNSMLENLDLVKLNSFLAQLNWIPDDIAIITSTKNTELYSETLTLKWIQQGLNEPAEFTIKETPKEFLSDTEKNKFEPVNIIQREYGEANEDIIKLGNGITLVLKQDSALDNKISLHGFSPIGLQCFDEVNRNLIMTPLIIKNAGVGDFDKFQIKEILSKTSFPFGVQQYMDYHETGIIAETEVKDLEILLQFIFLHFTSPRYDELAFSDWQRLETLRSGSKTNASYDFTDFKKRTLGELGLPLGNLRYKYSKEVNYSDAMDAYRELHASANDFTFIITGDFKKKYILPLLRKYLGNLPNSNNERECSPQSNELQNRPNSSNLELPYNVDNQFLSINFKTNLEKVTFKDEIKLELLKQTLFSKLQDLRYKEKLGVYIAMANSYFDFNNHNGNVEIYLQSNKEDFEKVKAFCMRMISELKNNLVPSTLLENSKKVAYLPKWQPQYVNSNKAITSKLYSYYRYDNPIIEPSIALNYLQGFDEYALMEAANEFLKDDRIWILTGSSKN